MIKICLTKTDKEPFLEMAGKATPACSFKMSLWPGRGFMAAPFSDGSPNLEMSRETPRKNLTHPAGCRPKDKIVLNYRKC
jgi:hypothetical protein